VVSLRNKLREALIILTKDQMFSTQKASIFSDTLKRRFTGPGKILCSISLRTSKTNENQFEIELFEIESTGDTEENNSNLIKKLSFIHMFEMNQIEHVKKIFNVKTVNELLVDIQSKNAQLETSLHNLRIAKDQKARMESELNVAKDIQMSMLPLIFPAFPQRSEIDVYATLIPAREVGGDFYDFHFLDDNHICFVVGDVSGKGVPAALMMAVTKTLLKSTAGTDMSTASILTHVNNEIAKDNDAYMFITIFIAILNTTTGEMVYSNAGHNPSYIIKSNKEVVKLGDLHGPVVGAMEDMTYTETHVNIDKSDIILGYTDGVTETQNLNNELYSDPRLINLLKNGDYSDPVSLVNLIQDSVFEFQGKAEQFDDITVLSIQFLEDKKTIKNNSFSVTIKNELNQMPQVIEAFEAFGEMNKLSFGVIQKFNIALDELLNNIISYGFQDDLEHEIDVDVELRNERLTITFMDDGVPFNPFRNDPPDTKLTLGERKIGGLGLHIVKNLVDEYDYKRQTDKNIITLIKYNINK
jgi:sigma-B regulation protein RsbU (phosphoserine phosphatase)